ncbi:65-kDa microtubule-associated protein 8 [Impatiens glandulifera]|uniref:65-kDa microtubule-associated protein 8 n=1 Tax=Impatiens glandulifera TaxID=253017 RepID=UPI001FB07F85|nr:65-kDa microtubule-associated protein 8 [Impatiens glandulifera]
MGSLIPNSISMLDTSCGYLLEELQIIWDEIGEDPYIREKILLDLEQDCLQVYRRKVDNANISRTKLHQELAESEAEFTHLLLILGERSLLPARPEKMKGTLKEQLASITPALHEMQLIKEERLKQFQSIQAQILKISSEIAGRAESNIPSMTYKNDLSIKKLEEYQNQLQRLLNDKNDRLERVEKYTRRIQNISAIMGLDSSIIITKVHHTLNEVSGLSKNISDDILAKLDSTLLSLEEEKHARLHKLNHLGKTLTNLWELMNTPFEDRLSSEISNPGSLTLERIQKAEAEVKRLDQQKASKMKDLFIKKKTELKEICKRSHMEIPSRSEIDNIVNLINSGVIDHEDLLTSMDNQIARAKEEAFSRQVIMEKVEKWMTAREEERWLEEYNRDDNRYSVKRGSHKNLRRAELGRIMVNKIPSLVESLIEKTKYWEEERNEVFLYDEVPLLEMLEEYNLTRYEKEEEMQKKQREKKNKLQIIRKVDGSSEQESTLSPSNSGRRHSNISLNGGLVRRFSMGIEKKFGSKNSIISNKMVNP